MKDKELKGLGGWLIVFQIGLIFGALMIIFALISAGASASLYGESLTIYEGLYYGIFASVIIVLLVLFYKKSKYFPISYIIYTWASFLLTSLIYVLEFGTLSQEITYSLTQSIVWTAYLVQSKRVENTFVN